MADGKHGIQGASAKGEAGSLSGGRAALSGASAKGEAGEIRGEVQLSGRVDIGVRSSVSVSTEIKRAPFSEIGIRAVSANAQTQQRDVRGKLTVSRGSSIVIGMHPDVRRDLPLARELNYSGDAHCAGCIRDRPRSSWLWLRIQSGAAGRGNATGFVQFELNLSAKWPELLKEIAPSVNRAAVLWDPAIPPGIGQFAIIQSVAPPLGGELPRRPV
jgi:hypothetical protein